MLIFQDRILIMLVLNFGWWALIHIWNLVDEDFGRIYFALGAFNLSIGMIGNHLCAYWAQSSAHDRQTKECDQKRSMDTQEFGLCLEEYSVNRSCGSWKFDVWRCSTYRLATEQNIHRISVAHSAIKKTIGFRQKVGDIISRSLIEASKDRSAIGLKRSKWSRKSSTAERNGLIICFRWPISKKVKSQNFWSNGQEWLSSAIKRDLV